MMKRKLLGKLGIVAIAPLALGAVACEVDEPADPGIEENGFEDDGLEDDGLDDDGLDDDLEDDGMDDDVEDDGLDG